MGIPTNTEGYWTFNESSGNAADSSGNGYTLTVANATYTTGKINNCASFDGTGDEFTRAAISETDFGTNAFTIAAWVKTSTAGGTHIICTNSTDFIGATRWALFTRNPNGKTAFSTSSSTYEAATTLADGAWHRVVVVREGTGANQFKIYLDGDTTPDYTGTCADNFANANTFCVGGETTEGEWFNGQIDELLIINGTAWGTSDITADWNDGDGVNYLVTNKTITPAALAISTAQPIVNIKITPTPLSISNSLTVSSVVISGVEPRMDIAGTIRTRIIKTYYPIKEALVAGITKQAGRSMFLVPQNSLVPDRRLKGIS